MEGWRGASKAELALTVGAAQNVSFEMNKFACYMDTDPVLLREASDVLLGAPLFATGKINIRSYVWHFTSK